MLEVSSIDPAFLPCFLIALALGLAAWGSGWLLTTRSGIETKLVSGLLFIAGFTATLCLGRFCFASLIPLLQVGFAAWSWTRPKPQSDPGPPVAFLVIVALACAGFEWWNMGWVEGGGAIRSLHNDLGYFAQEVKGVPQAHAASLWAATLGAQSVEGSGTRDVWYHWGPIWLSLAVTSTTHMPAIVALLKVVAMVLDFVLVLVAGAMVRTLTRWSWGRCLLVGALSLMGVQLVKVFGVQWLGDILPFGTLQHTRMSLAYNFSYKFEGMVVLAALTAWQRKEMALAVLMLFFASLSAPHTVAMGGVMAGVLGAFGLLLRRPKMWQTAAVITATLLSAWATLHWLFGVDLPKAGGQPLLVLDFNALRLGLRAGLIDAVLGLILGAISLPGIIHLIRGKDAQATKESRLLGWVALSGVIGSYVAYDMLSNVSDRFHFTMLTNSILVMPIGIWGAARMASIYKGAVRAACIALIAVGALMGAADLYGFRTHDETAPWKATDLERVQSALGGRSFGYFASSDRQWWISNRSTLASLLDVRCVRLNEIPSMEQGNSYSRYYGASRPYELLPLLPGETPEAWSLRFARRLGLECLMEIAPDTLPPALKSKCRELVSVTGLRLYELEAP